MRTHHAITWRAGDEDRDVLVTLHRATATLADVVAALAGDDGRPPIPPTSVTVDGVAHPGDVHAVTVLRRGAVLEEGAPSDRTCPDTTAVVVELRTLGGLGAGTAWPLPAGEHVVGRESGALAVDDPTISRRHARIAVSANGDATLTDLGSTNGTRLDGRALAAHVPAPWDPRAAAHVGTVGLGLARRHDRVASAPPTGPVHRPPRRRDPRPEHRVREARPAPAVPPTPRFSWAAALMPLALGVVLAVVIDPRLAWFGLTGPVMVTGSWLEERRRVRRALRSAAADAQADARRIAADRAVARDADAAWLRRVRPGVDALAQRVLTGAPTLWERRPDHDDAWVLRIGDGAVPWDGPAATAGECLADEPVSVPLGPDRVVGVVGHPGAARALARSLVVQSAVLHGPTDGPVVAATDRPDWAWIGWLPHAVGPDGRPLDLTELTGGPDPGPARALGADLVGAASRDAGIEALGTFGPPPRRSARRPLVVVDRRGPQPPLPAGAAAIVVAATVDALPAACTVVVDVTDDGTARLVEPATGRVLDDVAVTGVSATTADAVARALAGRTDPEHEGGAAGLPTEVELTDVLDLADSSSEAVRARWRANPTGVPRAPIGVTGEGPLVLDLDRDGPHALVAGTTGAGKSELLRTLVAALACSAPPTHLAFVLVDFKGGSAFDACARLPHVAGVVTDLDERLAARALRALEAELRERERRLRAAGVGDLATFHRTTGADDLPRLVVVVDEFATLVAEVPTFVDSLVDIAQRGRSLGVHLVLATQRPSGVVSPSIRANTDVRIALRVQDPADSTEVVDAADAAHLPRRCPGRAVVRLGPGARLVAQVARATVPARPSASVSVRPLGLTRPWGTTVPDDPADEDDGPTALDGLVDAAVAAAADLGLAPARRPWVDPLPDRIPWRASSGGPPVMGWVDDPDHQCRHELRWDPATGHLGVFGTVGAGTGPALRTVALTLAAAPPPDGLHLYAVDFGAGALAELEALPHVGAVVRAGERERLERLVARLVDERDRRRAVPATVGALAPVGAPAPAIVVLVDDLPALLASVSDLRSAALHDALRRLLADGPAVGISFAFTAAGPHAVSLAVLGGVAHRWVLRLADPAEALALGLRVADRTHWPVGRGDDAGSGLELQVAELADGDLDAVVRAAGHAGCERPKPIGVLPDLVPLGALGQPAVVGPEDWFVPVGLGGSTLGPVGLRLAPGDHTLVTGPVRSGRTTALRTIARSLAAAGVEVIAVCGRPSALATDAGVGRVVGPADVADLVATLIANDADPIDEPADASAADTCAADTGTTDDPGPADPVDRRAARRPDRRVVVLVDDADLVDDPRGALVRLVRAGVPGVHVVAAGPADRILGEYGHWTREVRRSRLGLALRPLVERDGEVWHTTLPRHPGPFGPGRGYLVHPDGHELVQIAAPGRDAVTNLRRSA